MGVAARRGALTRSKLLVPTSFGTDPQVDYTGIDTVYLAGTTPGAGSGRTPPADCYVTSIKWLDGSGRTVNFLSVNSDEQVVAKAGPFVGNAGVSTTVTGLNLFVPAGGSIFVWSASAMTIGYFTQGGVTMRKRATAIAAEPSVGDDLTSALVSQSSTVCTIYCTGYLA